MKKMKIRKRIFACLMAFVLLGISATIAPEVNAAVNDVTKEGDIVYIEWDVDDAYALSAAKTAPIYKDAKGIVENYLFGGWYKNIDFNHDNWEEGRANSVKTTEEIKTLDKVYAKFVPAYVLSMKAQNDTEWYDDTTSKYRTNMRMVSSVDSLEYAKVGYLVYVNNRDAQRIDSESKYVFEYLSVGTEEAGTYKEYKPSEVFGPESRYFVTWTYNKIPQNGYATQIYVEPYWITWDGTKVIGLPKYLHVEDGINGYVNIPINMRDAESSAAAAMVTLDYSPIAGSYELLDVKGVEVGRVFRTGDKDSGEMDSETSVTAREQYYVNIVGNKTDVTSNMNTFGLFACVRFKLKEGASADEEIVIGDNNLITFKVKNEAFSTSDEVVDTKSSVWDVVY